MNGHPAVRALVGGVGVAVAVVTLVIVAAGAFAHGLPAEGRADDPSTAPAAAPQSKPGELVVALTLANPVMQAGAVRDGGDIVLARGLEVEIARALGRRLGIPRVRFTYVRPASRLLAGTARPWDLTLATIPGTRAAAAVADLSDPYLPTDQAVVLRRGLAPLRSLADLRGRIDCALRGSDGARALAQTVRPPAKPLLPLSGERLLELVRTGVCDAALVDADRVASFVAGKGALLGPVRARISFGAGYVAAVTRGGPIAVADVDRALARMRADGTLHRLTRAWLGIDPSRLRELS